MKLQSLFILLLGAAVHSAYSQEPTLPITSTSSVLPVYMTLSANLNNFDQFANGGPDENWYIGFNNAWIVALPPALQGHYARAYVGAKIGREKTASDPENPERRVRIQGSVYMAISQTPAFTSEQSYFLTEAADIPAEADPNAQVGGVGDARWFWAEVPLSKVSFTEPNYLIIWSPTDYFVSSSSAPILAASASQGEPGASPRAWNNHLIIGVPPRKADNALETPLRNLNPALALKLVPENLNEVSVGDLEVTPQLQSLLVRFSVSGKNIESAWVEISRDQADWQKIGPAKNHPPFLFEIPIAEWQAKGGFLRAAAEDEWGNRATSAPTVVAP